MGNGGGTSLIESPKGGASDILIISEMNLLRKDLTHLNLTAARPVICPP